MATINFSLTRSLRISSTSTSGSSLSGAVRSELARLRRPSFIGIGLILTAVVAALTTLISFYGATQGPMAEMTKATLAEPDGIVDGVRNASNLLGLVVLSFAAIAVATDYTSGLIRLLVQAEPRRSRLVVGKWVALTGATVTAAAMATVIAILSAPFAAKTASVSTAAWTDGLAGTAITAFGNLALSLLVWAGIGMAITVVTRSVAAAIAGGIGYMLIVENLLGLVNDGITKWLPGQVTQAVVNSDAAELGHGTAVALAAGYVAAALAISIISFRRRDITA